MVKQVWRTDDDKTFDTEEQARAWEEHRQARGQKLVGYLKTHPRLKSIVDSRTGKLIEESLLGAVVKNTVEVLFAEFPEVENAIQEGLPEVEKAIQSLGEIIP